MTILHVESPQCSWLGEGRKVLIVDKDKRTFRFESPNPKEQKLNGVLSQLRVGLEGDACEVAYQDACHRNLAFACHRTPSCVLNVYSCTSSSDLTPHGMCARESSSPAT